MELLDKRLWPVFEKITLRIKEKQTLSLRKLSNARKEEVQFGRFVANQKVTVELLESELYSNMRSHCNSSHCLLIEDTSQVGFSLHRDIKDLGKVDKGQIKGFYIHPVLAIDAENYACHGIASLEFITRSWEDEKRTRKELNNERSKIVFEQKESFRWFSSIKKALPQCSAVPFKTVVADREADIYPLLSGLKEELEVDYVIRSRFNRPTKGGETILNEVGDWSVEDCYDLQVPATDKRSSHVAKMTVKFGSVLIKKSEGKSAKVLPSYHLSYVVEVKELSESVVNNEQPIHWVLLTSHVIKDSVMALQIVEWYKQRWNIEQIFRTLKNKGLKIESSQLEDYNKLQKITILALIASVKVMQLIRARHGKTQQKLLSVFNKEEQECIVLLNKHLEGKTEKLKNPYLKDSLAYASWVIARLSGWSGYESQRPPGPIDFLTGLQRFTERFEGFMLAKMT